VFQHSLGPIDILGRLGGYVKQILLLFLLFSPVFVNIFRVVSKPATVLP